MNSFVPLLLLLGLVAAPIAPASATATDGPLDEAREVMQQLDFRGRVTVRWDDSGVPRTASIDVRGGDGVVTIDGPTDAVASGTRRLVRHGDAWDLLWPGGIASAPPQMLRKYEVSHGPGPLVAGRSTKLVEVRHGGDIRERLALDVETGLLLQREQFGPAGTPTRQLVFETVEMGSDPPRPPAMSGNSKPDVHLVKDALPAPYVTPTRLSGSYHRVGVYRHADAVHVLYSDGLYGLSVFEQPGRINWDALPAGEAVRVGDGRGHRYSWAGGHVVLWESRSTAWTVVGDGPVDQVMAAARSLPGARPLSTMQRVRQHCRRLVEAISGRA